jgi:hypothetical protein
MERDEKRGTYEYVLERDEEKELWNFDQAKRKEEQREGLYIFTVYMQRWAQYLYQS